ncbi:serine/threonine-protein kinase [Microlunatus soli]|uniref:non-specific serine/threonine protein kinase n=1 Tax=Microlunatus soli TaxID=630515 RepID=A0A1H2AH28_9ACTN|nr:serine/threonine-protein kinase [Microlunatus soli]SDT45283.1 Protein kinase domain-containing protein [Microlunatus soli]
MKQIGRYRLDRVLGAGAFATVWKAYDPDLDVPVAVKVLADNWAVNADVRERFLTEARLLRRIQSPRVVRVYDVGVSPPGGDRPEQPYFVMDFIEGGALTGLVGQLPADEAVRLAAEASEAVQVLHEAGIVHRDLKPGNFLIDTRHAPLHVLVADLGSAKKLADASGYTVTTGSPAYMAPEQADQFGGFDSRADVYALGVVSYELLAGRRPFAGLTAGELVRRSRDVRPEPIAARLGLPPQIDQLLAAAMDPDPDGRPADAHTFGTTLRAALPAETDTAVAGPPAWQQEPTVLQTPPQPREAQQQTWLRREVSADDRLPAPTRTEDGTVLLPPPASKPRRGWPAPAVILVAVVLFVLAAAVAWTLK